MTTIGFIGPAAGDSGSLRDALEFLLVSRCADAVIYLGTDDLLESVISGWALELAAGDYSEDAFLERAVDLATRGTADELQALLDADAAVARLAAIRRVPKSPARAVEMVEDRILLAVYDKAILDEEDIANATIVAYGKSQDADLKRFGPRYFVTPGPLSRGKVVVVESAAEGAVDVVGLDLRAQEHFRERLTSARTKMSVSA